jgi:hypothetical protein
MPERSGDGQSPALTAEIEMSAAHECLMGSDALLMIRDHEGHAGEVNQSWPGHTSAF